MKQPVILSIFPIGLTGRNNLSGLRLKIFLLVISPLLVVGAFSSRAACDCNITEFGAVSDGITISTVAIQRAIDVCNKEGGGRVIVPTGTFLTGGFCLKSHVELFLEHNAVLLGSVEPSDYSDNGYVPADASGAAGHPTWLALIFAKNATDISISGPGTVDGQGQALAENVWQTLYGWDPTRKADESHRVAEKYRPQLIYFFRCKNIRVQDVMLKNSACWVETYEKCNGLQMTGVRVDSTVSWNNDGIDMVDSKNAELNNCNFNSDDDGICLKSYDPNDSCENILVTNCIVRSSASAFKIGTASLGGFRHILVQGLYVYDTHRSTIALEGVDGGFIDDIKIDGVTAEKVGNAFFIRRGARSGKAGPVGNISIKNMTVYYIPETESDLGYKMALAPDRDPHNILPSSIVGLPGNDVQHVTLENIHVLYEGGGNARNGTVGSGGVPENAKGYPEFSMFGELPAWGLYIRHANNIHMKNVQMQMIRSDARPAYIFDDVKSLERESVIWRKSSP